jgi:putative ABC transport system ATP-binding protein
MSGGERQRVAIARALINNPDLILADEPTGSLDSVSTEQVLGVISEIRQQRGITIVVVTHDPEVSGRADRVVSMRDGKIEPGKEYRQ